nr:MAG TPA: hypothetical protein [Bacteriophage sp.]
MYSILYTYRLYFDQQGKSLWDLTIQFRIGYRESSTGVG